MLVVPIGSRVGVVGLSAVKEILEQGRLRPLFWRFLVGQSEQSVVQLDAVDCLVGLLLSETDRAEHTLLLDLRVAVSSIAAHRAGHFRGGASLGDYRGQQIRLVKRHCVR